MEIQLKIDFEKINRGFVDLNKASRMAARNTLNIMAALSRTNYINNLKQNMILRNDFTEKSISYTRVKSDRLSEMESIIGARKRASYLKLHEESGRRKPKRKKGSRLAIPQRYARGGSKKRLVREMLYLTELKEKKIKGKFKKRFRSRRAMGVARAYVAFREKKMLKYSDNLFFVASFRKNKTRIKYKKRHLYNVSEPSVYIRQRKMLQPAVIQPAKDAQNIYNSQMNKLLRSGEII